MPTASPRPDLNALLDAYAFLGVEHSANPGEIRLAYKEAVRKHHPDRYPAGSPAQREATERMTAINAAFELAKDAPLRHHRVSTRSQPDVPWDDAELDEAIRRARNDRVVANVMSGLTLLVLFVAPWLVIALIGGAGTTTLWSTAAFCIFLAVVIGVGGRTGSRLWSVTYYGQSIFTAAGRVAELFLSRH
jgi:hypothetical protein